MMMMVLLEMLVVRLGHEGVSGMRAEKEADRADVPVLIPLVTDNEEEDEGQGRMHVSTGVAMMLALTIPMMMEVPVICSGRW